LPKAGAAFDLAIALALAHAWADGPAGEDILVMGELTLSGDVCGVDAVVPALLAARRAGIDHLLVPRANRVEAAMAAGPPVLLAGSLPEALLALDPAGRQALALRSAPSREAGPAGVGQGTVSGQGSVAPGQAAGPDQRAHPGAEAFDTAVFGEHPLLLLGLMAAAAGGHHLMLYGPPGAGKTMALRFLGSLLPELDEAGRLEVNRLYSLAGLLNSAGGLVLRPPVRMPHHGSSPESLMGGGMRGLPGEISLAHRGLLVLDEAPEFRASVLQALREPMEEGLIRLGRANGALWFPAAFLLGLSLNPCPCGRLGGGRGSCACGSQEIQRYWGRIGAPVIDRIDIRLPLGMGWQAPAFDSWARDCPVAVDWRDAGGIRRLVEAAHQGPGGPQGTGSRGNGRLQGCQVEAACRLDPGARLLLDRQAGRQGRLARARHGIMRLAKTIAELGGSDRISEAAMAAAIRLRSPVEVLPGLTMAE
jgi:magnesium chelatase family protein